LIHSPYDAGEILKAIDWLRAGAGESVEIHSDNPDFNGLPDCVISVTGYWTDWQPRSFRADTVLACLLTAVAARNVALAEKGPA